VPIYSGYIWQCWTLKDKLQKDSNPSLKDAYFLWEHTDFTKRDAVDYNLESLERKAEYLEKRTGPLVMLQKSCSVVPGQPYYPQAKFAEFLWDRNPAARLPADSD
jgi:hypothetical protein